MSRPRASGPKQATATPKSRAVDRDGALGLLRSTLDDPTADFRDGQWEAIDAVANRNERLLLVQRTGWGKSAVYFVATRILRDRGRGPTLIVSPLLALMRNQIEAAERLGVRALSINSTNRDDWPKLHETLTKGVADALLISPERLANDDFTEKVLAPIAGSIGLLVVDEVHCISDWGHDFRPDYRRLNNILRSMPPNVPILGTTATANDRVIDDVQSQLGNVGLKRGPLVRRSLWLQTLRLPSQAERLAWLLDHLPKLPGTGIIYVLTKRDAHQVADWLCTNGVVAKAYYGDVRRAEGDSHADSAAYRQQLEDRLAGNEVKALVATSALGMGYDKPDLGFVIHYQAPASIIAYYQQVGRAGRAIPHAFGLLMTGYEDGEIHDYFRRTAFPSSEWVGTVLNALEDADGLTVAELERFVNLSRSQIDKVLKTLSVDNPAPLIRDGSKWRRTAVPYRMDHEAIARLAAQREREWQEVQDYVDEPGCLMMYLARVLDDPAPKPCKRCASCRRRPIVDAGFTRASAAKALQFLRRSDGTITPRQQIPKGAFSVTNLRGRLSPEQRHEPGRYLCRWADAGWGKLVEDGKHAGSFDDDLVDAVAGLVRDRWRPEPRPAWVTCVPSNRHPNLVPDFARRISQRLGLPFHPVLAKTRDNEPQKRQENGFHQAHNLDGAFGIRGRVPPGGVLLVDDIVDSGWTFTVATALLRQAGSGPVFPVALATTSPGA